jgi:SAM-dependent methyltransferase
VQQYWDRFYRRHETRFFRDRRYMQREFPDIEAMAATCHAAGTRMRLLECGCGVGNVVFPLVSRYQQLDVVCVDLSRRAIDFVKVWRWLLLSAPLVPRTHLLPDFVLGTLTHAGTLTHRRPFHSLSACCIAGTRACL